MTGNSIRRFSLEELKGKKSQTRDKAPEGPALDAAFWEKAKPFETKKKRSVHLRVDEDVFEFFKQGGKGHITRMNAVLKAYVEASKSR
jgi:uncharacterized protein (DUF4415 family)